MSISALDILTSYPRDPAAVKALSEDVFELRAQTGQTMDQGVTVEGMKPLQGLLAACEAAENLLTAIT